VSSIHELRISRISEVQPNERSEVSRESDAVLDLEYAPLAYMGEALAKGRASIIQLEAELKVLELRIEALSSAAQQVVYGLEYVDYEEPWPALDTLKMILEQSK
jgi:hypothetical protein